jgi:hypothetical protein
MGMKLLCNIFIAGCVLALFAVGPIACENKGPAEKAGKKIDETVDAVKDSVKKAVD